MKEKIFISHSGDIIIERWIPYGAQAKRRTIVQRAPAPKPYPAPRNVIIQYEPVGVRVVRQFQRLGVVQANPAAYMQQYGASLLDASALLQQARVAGVVEDIVRFYSNKTQYMKTNVKTFFSSHHLLLLQALLDSALLAMAKNQPVVSVVLALDSLAVVLKLQDHHSNHQASQVVSVVVK